MYLNEYRQKVDATFVKRYAPPPSRLHLKYFNHKGNATPYLQQAAQKIEELWKNVSPEKIHELYVFGTHATGKFWEGSDFDIGALVHIDFFEAKELEGKLNDLVMGKGTPDYANAKKRYEVGERDFVHCHVHIVKPFGVVYDLREKKWVTFGKTERDHHDFEWEVLGLRVD